MRTALTMDVLATDLADYLVRKGVRGRTIMRDAMLTVPVHTFMFTQVPFRETHHVSGRAVALAEVRKCQLNELTVQDFKGLHDKFEDDVLEVFDFEASVERRKAIGGPSRGTLDRQIAVLRDALSSSS